MIKRILAITTLLVTPAVISACSTNVATGRSQFTGLMSPAQELQIGASEHQKIAAQYGLYEEPRVLGYVQRIGEKVSAYTEDPNVQYKFYVIDSPIVNAFALPGGYVYISRGLLALANNEAEVAAVVAHEIGHVTARHSAERYSRSAVTALGANVLAAALDSGAAAQALGLGANLYLSSYSRAQENESDSLGLRYMTRAGYAPDAMPAFLSSLQAQSDLDAKKTGRKQGVSYLSTHPATQSRVQKTVAEAQQYADQGTIGHDSHFRVIDGMPYGDSPGQGFARGNTFYHPDMGFAFDVPDRFYTIQNQPSQVLATKKNGPAIVFDMASNPGKLDAATYLRQVWLKGEKINSADRITINGMRAATGMFDGNLNGTRVSIRLIAIEFAPDRFARFQIAIPKTSSTTDVESLKRASYSFRKLGTSERQKIRPYRVDVVTARSGDTIASLASKMPYGEDNQDLFIVMNALLPNQALKSGRQYKIVR